MYSQEYFNDELVNVICKNVPHDSRNFMQSSSANRELHAAKHTDLISEITDTVHNRIYASEKSRRSPSHPIQLAVADLICSILITTFIPATPC